MEKNQQNLKHLSISRLIREIDRCMKEKDRIVFKEINFKPRFLKLYHHILENDGIPQVQLSSLSKIKPPSVSATLVEMERDGYIERKTDISDKRIIRIYLTEKGRKLENKIEQILRRNEMELLEGLTPTETDTLRQLLLKIRHNLTKGV